MTANEHCLGLECRFAQTGEALVWADDRRFRDCEDVLTASDNADPIIVQAEQYVAPGVAERDRCGYAVKMILEARGVLHA
jgi:hypothetical protein